MLQFDTKRVATFLIVGLVFCAAPFVLPGTMTRELTRVVVLAGAAMTLNLLVGATGLISLGQGLFFGFGAYAVAIGTIKYNLSLAFSALFGLVLALPLSLLVALVALRARHLFFGLLTLAIGQVGYVLVTSNYWLTGGDDGLVGIRVPAWLEPDLARHFLAVGALVAVGLLLLWLLASPFGAMLAAVRDNADRVVSLGGNPKRYEIVAMLCAGMLGTVFGIVAGAAEGSVEPLMLSWTASAMLLVMVALGGRSAFLGPVLGAAMLELSRLFVQARSTNSDLVVGLLIILCAILFPEGLGLAYRRLINRFRPRRELSE